MYNKEKITCNGEVGGISFVSSAQVMANLAESRQQIVDGNVRPMTGALDEMEKKYGFVNCDQALAFFYRSQEYQLIRDGISDLHCMSDKYLAQDLADEYISSLKS